MILACPFCKARFLISASLFAAGPRMVACARCRHGWRADASDDAAMPQQAQKSAAEKPQPESVVISDIPVVADSLTTPTSELPRPPGVLTGLMLQLRSHYDALLPHIRLRIRYGAIGLLLLCALGLIYARQSIAHHRPHIEAVYNFIGLHIYHSGEGLAFTHIRSEIRYDSGINNLVVEGKIHNETKNTQQIPDILASALGSDGKIIQSWQIDAPASNVGPGQDVAFTSLIKAPRDGVADLNLSFIEPKK